MYLFQILAGWGSCVHSQQHQAKHFLTDAVHVTSFNDLNKRDHNEQQNLNVSYVSYVRPYLLGPNFAQ